MSEAYLGSCQATRMEHFRKINDEINHGLKPYLSKKKKKKKPFLNSTFR